VSDFRLERELLDALRWHADMAIENYEGESVWLKQVEAYVVQWKDLTPEEQKRDTSRSDVHVPRHITDCCLTSDPCERHATMNQDRP